MSAFGGPPVPMQASPPPGKPESDIPLWVVLAAVGLLVVVAAGAVVAVMQARSTKSTTVYPEQWDSRVAPYATLAEEHRGLKFLHPVKVRFLPAAKFEKTVTSDEEDLTKKDRIDIERFTGLLRAVGLITGDLDLFDAYNEASGGGTLAYYSYEDERITIRGKKLTPAARSTLVHELTHVLQDQHFQVGDRVTKLAKASDDDASSSEAAVLDAIIEGDAVRVETLYRDSLTAKQRKALDAGRNDEVTEAGKAMRGVPKVVLTMMSSPYTLGEGLVQTVAEEGGNSAVDQLFQDTPTHESALLDPFEVLADDTGAAKVEMPKLRKAEKEFESGEFGVLTMYLMLAERLPLLDALAAADGWGGDAYVAYELGGASCVRMTYAGDSSADTMRMLSALQRWIAAAPGSPAGVSRDGAVLHFDSCDPGKAADIGNDASGDALDLVTVRASLGLVILRGGAPPDMARCVAGRAVRAFSVAQLVDPRFGASDPAVQARIQRLAFSCR